MHNMYSVAYTASNLPRSLLVIVHIVAMHSPLHDKASMADAGLEKLSNSPQCMTLGIKQPPPPTGKNTYNTICNT